MAARRSISIEPKTEMVTIKLTIKQAGLVADALSYAMACSMDNFGSGYDPRDTDDRQRQHEWKTTDAVSQMLATKLTRHEQRKSI